MSVNINLPVNCQITFNTFNKTVDCKLDTGATMCCLHADNIQIQDNVVLFTNTSLSPNVINAPIAEYMEVKTADNSGDSRPVILLDVTIGDQAHKNVAFNLNDRSHMDSPVLVGQNLLSAANISVEVPPVSEGGELNVAAPLNAELPDDQNVSGATVLDQRPDVVSGGSTLTFDSQTNTVSVTLQFSADALLELINQSK